METRLEKLQSQKYLLISLIASGFAFLIAESIGKETAIVFGNWIFVLVIIPVILAGILVKRNGLIGNHGKSWIFFLIFIVVWFVAEQIFMINELYYHIKPFPSSADIFYILGYPFYFLFLIYYLKPFKNLISKKLIISTVLIAIAILIPNLYMTFQNNSNEIQSAIIIGAIYPFADAIVLIPSMLGVVLFFRGKVNFLWSFLLIGLIIEVVADTAFQYFSLNNDMYTGNPVDILFFWSYIFFSFGLYDHIKIFKKAHDIKNTFDNKEDLR